MAIGGQADRFMALADIHEVFKQLGSHTHLEQVSWRDQDAVDKANAAYKARVEDAVNKYTQLSDKDREYFRKQYCTKASYVTEANEEFKKLGISLELKR